MTEAFLLAALPDWLLFILIVGGSVVLAVAGTIFVRQHRKPPTDEAHNEVAGFIFAAVSVLYAVVLAFMVFAVWEAYSNARQAASNEAAALIAVARDTSSLPEPARHQVHDLLREYDEIVTNEEWPAMGQDIPGYDGSPRATQVINEIWAIYQSVPRSEVDSNTTIFLTNLSEQRAIRLQSNESLSGAFGIVLVVGAVCTIAFCLVLHMEDARLHAGMTVVLTALIASCLWLILEINQPFVGSVSVSPEAFEHALHVLDTLPR